jgi:hypothetical protein
MDDFKNQLPPEFAQKLDDLLSAQCKDAFDRVVDTDWKLTQHNFLTNAGGAAATLAYLGTKPTPTFAAYPLCIFLIGVMLSVIEIRALLVFYGALFVDASKRRKSFWSNALRASEAVPVPNLAPTARRVNHMAGVLSQAAFIVGALIGIVLYVYRAA